MASNLKVIIDNPQTTIKIPSGTRMLVRRSCHAALEHERYEAQAVINVTFADNALMEQYIEARVSSYEAPELVALPSADGGEDLGRIILSIERVIELTKVYNQPFEMGVVFASVHGVLNLLGQYYTDPAAKAELMKKEAIILTRMGYAPLAEYRDSI